MFHSNIILSWFTTLLDLGPNLEPAIKCKEATYSHRRDFIAAANKRRAERIIDRQALTSP